MITEYHTLIAGLIGGTGLGLLVGCVLGWILRKWKQEGDEQIRTALMRWRADVERSKPEIERGLARLRALGAYGYWEAKPKQETGTNNNQPVRPYLESSRIGVSEQILVDRDELIVLCDRVITHGRWMDDSDAPDRARQMLEKIGGELR